MTGEACSSLHTDNQNINVQFLLSDISIKIHFLLLQENMFPDYSGKTQGETSAVYIIFFPEVSFL